MGAPLSADESVAEAVPVADVTESKQVTEKETFDAHIRRYNASPDADTLAQIRSYIAEHAEDEDRLSKVGRELVINDQTVDLLLDVADYTFRNTDLVAPSGLGFAILRLDASDFWQSAPMDQQIRFEGLLSAILELPEERVHRFTRYTATRAKERIRVPVEAEAGALQLLQHLTPRQRFEVLGTDYNAVQSVGTMARALEYIVGDYLPYIDDFPQPLWVRIEPGPQRTPPFQIQVAENGNVGVIFFWNEQVSMETVAQALSWALLQRIAIWRWNVRDETAVPYWLLNAIAAEIPIQVQPARNQGAVREISITEDLLPLSDLLKRSALGTVGVAQDPAADLQSLWFYRYLRDQAPNRKTFGLLIEAFLSEKDGMLVLQRMFPGQVESAERLQQWWEVGLASLVHRQQGIVYSMDRSNELVAALNGVTAWWDGEDRRLRGPALLPLREDPRWQSAFWRQQRELKLELARINPIYFNALLSLGQFYDLLLERGGSAEKLGTAELRTQAEATYAQFLQDWAHAQALHRAVAGVLEQETP